MAAASGAGETGTSIKAKTRLVLENRKNANEIIGVVCHLASDDPEVLRTCILSVQKIFKKLISTKEMFLPFAPSDADNTNEEGSTKEEKYKMWLRERYKDATDCLLDLLNHKYYKVQELSFTALMNFISEEYMSPITKQPAGVGKSVPAELLLKTISKLVSHEMCIYQLISKIAGFLKTSEMRVHCLKCLKTHIVNPLVQENSIKNIYSLMEQLTIVVSTGIKTNSKSFKRERSALTTAWLDFVQCKLSLSVYKRVLVNVPTVMSCMSNPLVLSDFLIRSYNMGGIVSLLALHGLFILVHKHNLNYPDFYEKLYTLLEPWVFHAKYKAKFFNLLDIFLSSSHLPAYMVAAFIKKLARLSLTAQNSGVALTVPFIYKLIKNHPSSKVLVHRLKGQIDYTSDPYDISEPQLSKCNALQSSLWELKTLQSHYSPFVAVMSKKANRHFTSEPLDISDKLNLSGHDIFTKEVQRDAQKKGEVPWEFQSPKGLFSTNSKTDALWES